MAKAKSAKNVKKSAAKPAPKKPAAKAAAKTAPKAAAKAKGAAGKGAGKPSGDERPSPMPPLNPKRKLGLRGAAPWAARHAAKHAAEARARAAEPAPPGSARATIRTPSGAEQIKQKIADLHMQTQKVRALRKRLDKGFYEIGQVLTDIQQRELFQAKGFGSFEAFLEREIDLGKLTCLKLMKVPVIFQREAALDFGMDRVFSAISALEGELIPKSIPSAPGSKPGLPLKPPSRLVG
ncbi:MAG TPA: hypothetical protein VL400_00510 [Polyangiaceae bacterium]|jgi:hypothetical protein|nr:hypothetical protein [Polyangiaceae bacterium]